MNIFERMQADLRSIVQSINRTTPRFNGPDYAPARDNTRLNAQYERIFNLMSDGIWRTLKQIHVITGDPEASISAQLRHMRKPRFGSHTVEKEYLGNGLFQYRVDA